MHICIHKRIYAYLHTYMPAYIHAYILHTCTYSYALRLQAVYVGTFVCMHV